MIHFAAKVSEQVNRKCPSKNTILQLLTPTPTLHPQTPHLLHHTHRRWCHLANKLKTFSTLLLIYMISA